MRREILHIVGEGCVVVQQVTCNVMYVIRSSGNDSTGHGICGVGQTMLSLPLSNLLLQEPWIRMEEIGY